MQTHFLKMSVLTWASIWSSSTDPPETGVLELLWSMRLLLEMDQESALTMEK